MDKIEIDKLAVLFYKKALIGFLIGADLVEYERLIIMYKNRG